MRVNSLAQLILIGLLTVVAACGDDRPRDVDITLREWSLMPGAPEVKGGRLRFSATNDGVRQHQLVVVKSDLQPDQLPVLESMVDGTKVNIVAQVGPLAPATSAQLDARLSPGKYVLICNLTEPASAGSAQSHYENGMYASFFVRP